MSVLCSDEVASRMGEWYNGNVPKCRRILFFVEGRPKEDRSLPSTLITHRFVEAKSAHCVFVLRNEKLHIALLLILPAKQASP